LRFFKQSKLEELTEKIHIIDDQLAKTKDQLQHLTDNSKADPIILFWLKQRGFDYYEQSGVWQKIVNEKQAQISMLEKEKQKLQPAIQEAKFQQELQQKEIRFTGPELESFHGSTANLKCSVCKNKFQIDFRSFGAFQNMLCAANEQELQFLYARKINVFEVKCPGCNGTFTVTVWRGKI